MRKDAISLIPTVTSSGKHIKKHATSVCTEF